MSIMNVGYNVGSKFLEVNNNCLKIAEELTSIGQYVTIDRIQTVLLQRYNIGYFEQLNIGNYFSLPVISLIWELNIKIAGFLEAYFASRSVITITSIDIDLVQYLLSLNYPSIGLKVDITDDVNNPPTTSANDPNELSLDFDTEEMSENKPEIAFETSSLHRITSFVNFGLGKLHHHPIIAQYFHNYNDNINTNINPMPSNSHHCQATVSNVTAGVTSKDVLQHLVDFLAEFNCHQFRHEFHAAQFAQYLCNIYQTPQLQHIGVLLQGDLLGEVLALKHAVNRRQELHAEITKQELARLNQTRIAHNLPDNNGNSEYHNKDSANNKRNNSALYDKDCVIRMRDASQYSPQIGSFIQTLREKLDSPYSPSYGKLQKIVIAYAHKHMLVSGDGSYASGEEGADGGTQRKSNGKRRKKQQDEQQHNSSDHIFSSGDNSLLMDILTEYSMLHLGGHKHFLKRVQRGEDEKKGKSAEIDEIKECGGSSDDSEEERQVQDSSDYDACEESRVVVEIRSDEEEGSTANVPVVVAASPAVQSEEKKEPIISCSGDSASLGRECAQSQHSIAGGNASSDTTKAAVRPPLPPTPTPPLHSTMETLTGRYEARIRSNISVHDALPDNLSSNLAVVTSAQLRHLFPYMGSLDCSDPKAVGRWGEMLVYQYLVMNYTALTDKTNSSGSNGTFVSSGSGAVESSGHNSGKGGIKNGVEINWLNEVEESRASYDIVLLNKDIVGRSRTTYIEVKTTRFADLNVFELSLWEWEFATKEPRVPYHIYRVFNAGDINNVRIVIIKDIFTLISERKIRLCLAV